MTLSSAPQPDASERSEMQPPSGQEPEGQRRPGEQKPLPSGMGLMTKTTLWALGVGVLPMLIVGMGAYVGQQTIEQQLKRADAVTVNVLADTQRSMNAFRLNLLLATGGLAVITGAIATFLARRTMQPVLQASRTSTRLINRLQPQAPSVETATHRELQCLQHNINLLENQLPQLLSDQQGAAQTVQQLTNITQQLNRAHSEEEVLTTAVRATRAALNADRVVVFQMNIKGEGQFIAEDLVAGWAKVLWSTVHDPCFGDGYHEQYQAGRVRAINDIHNSDLSDCHIGLLERFGVKANLVAPILKNDQLFGLLIAHQCSGPRFWQPPDIDLMTQIGTQISLALDSAHLVQQLTEQTEYARQQLAVARSIRASLNEETVLNTTVTEVRKALRADRVIVYVFDPDWYGSIVAESVLPGFPKTLWQDIKDPCFAQGFVEKYQAGRLHAIDNVQTAGLGDCYLAQLERYEIKANLVAPILQGETLFGLLIAHQCATPRTWLQPEQDFMAQTAIQVGYALDQAILLARIDAEEDNTRQLISLTRQIRTTLNEEAVLTTTVTEVRKALKCDRVIVYAFDEQWYGTIIAESVLSGFPKSQWAEIRDPCFAQRFITKYQAGRIHTITDVENANLGDCYLAQLQQFEVKANLVAPILKDNQLFGLLIAHQCSGPRNWQTTEQSLIAQIARQVGYALEHARLMGQLDKAYQSVQGVSVEQQQQLQYLQGQVTDFLNQSQPPVQTWATEIESQMNLVTVLYNHIQAVVDGVQAVIPDIHQGSVQEQQIKADIQTTLEAFGHLQQTVKELQATVSGTTAKVQRIDQPAQQLLELINHLSSLTAQMKLQAMNATLEATRLGESGQGFAAIGEQIHQLMRAFDRDVTQAHPLVTHIQADTQAASSDLEQGQKQLRTGAHWVNQTQETLSTVVAHSEQMVLLMEKLSQTAQAQVQESTAASQTVVEIANATRQSSEASVEIVAAFEQLTHTVSDA